MLIGQLFTRHVCMGSGTTNQRFWCYLPGGDEEGPRSIGGEAR